MRERIEEAAQEVFDELGAGWSESIYHKALIRELADRGIPHYTEGSLSVMYKGGSVGTRRPDLLVHTEDGRSIIVELKAGSNSGWFQLEQYLDMAEKSNDLGEIRGGVLIQFNEELSVEAVELGPAPNPDDNPLVAKKLKELPTGVDIYHVASQDHEVQVNFDKNTETASISAEQRTDDEEVSAFHEEAIDYVWQQTELER